MPISFIHNDYAMQEGMKDGTKKGVNSRGDPIEVPGRTELSD
jgi:hypothetical protein